MPTQPFFNLLNALGSLNNAEKYSLFHVVNTVYKSSPKEESNITADILIPKTLCKADSPGPCPVMVRIHGGFLVTGSSLYQPWFNNWILDYARANKAIIISPNYRLLPEVSGREILDDMSDFWHWLHSGKVDQVLGNSGYDERLKLDLNSILAVGESAGGYLATQLAISYPSQIKCVIAAYPMVDLRSRFFTAAYQKPIVGVPNIPDSLVDCHLLGMTSTRGSNTSPFTWVSEADPPDRLELAFAIIQNGRFPELFGGWEDRKLFPMERIEDLLATGRALQLPPMFILHGEDDSAVPVDGSKRFVQFMRRVMPHTPVVFHTQGGDHGFDAGETLATPWLRTGLEMISRAW